MCSPGVPSVLLRGSCLRVFSKLLPNLLVNLFGLQALLADPVHHGQLLQLVQTWPHSCFHPTALIDAIATRMQRYGQTLSLSEYLDPATGNSKQCHAEHSSMIDKGCDFLLNSRSL